LLEKVIELTAGVKTVCCSEFNKFNNFPLPTNTYSKNRPVIR